MNQEVYFERGLQIVRILNEHGFLAYIVGGAVRDGLLNRPFTDIDIATSASPKEVMEFFPEAHDEYIDFGCVTIFEDEMIFEITSFRTENYDQGKPGKPNSIIFTKSLEEDLLRRDYTINALAYSENKTLVDFVKGEADINSKTIRIIGNGVKRYKEDPSRILRGLSLVSKLDFKIESSTLSAMKKTKDLIKTVSNNKFSGELFTIINEQYASKAIKYIVRNNLFSYDVILNKWIRLINRNLSKLSTIEMLAILKILGYKILDNSCYNKESIKQIEDVVSLCNYLKNNNVTGYDIFKNGIDSIKKANFINTLTITGYKNQLFQINKLYRNLKIKSRDELVYKNNDIILHTNNQGGPHVRFIMDKIEEKVLNGELPNEYRAIDNYVIEILPLYYSGNPDSAVINGEVVEESHPVIETVEPIMITTEEKAIEEPTPSIQMDHQEVTSFDINQLYFEYKKLLKSKIDAELAQSISQDMSYQEIMMIQKTLETKYQILILKDYPEYQILKEKGMI